MAAKVTLLQSKLTASSIHLCISFTLLLMIVAWLYWVLYPSFYFGMSGGIQGFWLILGVDMILGPVLTFLVFNKNKKKREILTDLATIGLIQFAALAYGMYTVYQERPQLILMFEHGTSTILNAREVAENPKLTQILHHSSSSIASVPAILNLAENGEVKQVNPLTKPNILSELSQANRHFITNPDDLSQLQSLEARHKNIIIISMMGKYTEAYIVFDENLNYLDKISDKPIS